MERCTLRKMRIDVVDWLAKANGFTIYRCSGNCNGCRPYLGHLLVVASLVELEVGVLGIGVKPKMLRENRRRARGVR